METFVIKCADEYLEYFLSQLTMTDYCQAGTVFKNFPSAIEAIDMTFQRSYAKKEK